MNKYDDRSEDSFALTLRGYGAPGPLDVRDAEFLQIVQSNFEMAVLGVITRIIHAGHEI